MKIITPVTIDDAALVSSSIPEALPFGSSAVTYDNWSAGTTYAKDAVVCWIYNASPFYGQTDLRFGVFKSRIDGSLNYEPGKRFYTFGGTLPGTSWWELIDSFEVWSATKVYPANTTVGRVSGATGAVYQSKAAANLNNDPVSATAWWRQTAKSGYNTWSSATTYAAGDFVVVFPDSGTRGLIYKSLQSGNLNKTPSAEPLWWEIQGESYKNYDATATYGLGDVVLDLVTHHLFESVQAGNTNHPLTDAAWWIDLGATNRWAMFDAVTSSRAVGYGSISFTVQLPSVCDTLALMDIVASNVSVVAYNGATEVYNQTFDLANNTLITDWRRWFFDPLTFKADLIIGDLPAYPSLRVVVTATLSGGQVSIGSAIFGLASTLGATVYGVKTGIIDFTRKETDEFGTVSLVERPYAKRGQFKVWVRDDQVDGVSRALSDNRAKLCVYQGSGEYASTWIYGFFRDFNVSIDGPNQSFLNIEIEGLT